MAAFTWAVCVVLLLGAVCAKFSHQLMQKSQRRMMQPTMIMTPLHRHAVRVPSAARRSIRWVGPWRSWPVGPFEVGVHGVVDGGGGGGGAGKGGGPNLCYPAGCRHHFLEHSFVRTTGNSGHPNNAHPHDHGKKMQRDQFSTFQSHTKQTFDEPSTTTKNRSLTSPMIISKDQSLQYFESFWG